MISKPIVIVTGALGGIGTATIKKLVADGYFVIGTIRPGSTDKSSAWQEKHDYKSTELELVELDVADFEMTQKVVADLIDRFGKISGLVNNAGITKDTSFKKMTSNQWSEVLDTNLSGSFNMCKAVFNNMTENGFGRIVNISSINGQKGQFGQVNYAASKAGIYGLTKSIAIEGARKGVTCNSISPGYVKTEMTADRKSVV